MDKITKKNIHFAERYLNPNKSNPLNQKFDLFIVQF